MTRALLEQCVTSIQGAIIPLCHACLGTIALVAWPLAPQPLWVLLAMLAKPAHVPQVHLGTKQAWSPLQSALTALQAISVTVETALPAACATQLTIAPAAHQWRLKWHALQEDSALRSDWTTLSSARCVLLGTIALLLLLAPLRAARART